MLIVKGNKWSGNILAIGFRQKTVKKGKLVYKICQKKKVKVNNTANVQGIPKYGSLLMGIFVT